jgi:glycosyltransferase involved in cell wall biosynthesis
VRRKIEFERYDAVFTRDAFLVRSGFFYEMHDVRKGPFQRSALKRAAGVVCITKGLAEYCKKTGLEENKIMVAPDAVDLRKFFVAEDKKACRAKLGLPINKKIILYAGHLYAWKGADVLAKAASLLSSDALAVFVGGTDSDIVLFRKKFGSDQRIIIAGRQPHDLIPYYLKAADVLVLPNSAKEDISRLYTSPLKLFEYMASGVPIVASDLPSLREIIDESSAFFAKPDDPRSLAETLKRVLEDPTGAARGAETALSVVGRYDWDSRAARIISLITSLS